jgi:hypothetical protein
MESTVDIAFTQQYGNRIRLLSQQMKSKFVPRVENDTISGAEYKAYDRLGEAEGQEVTTRHGDTPLNEQEHSRRWVSLTDVDIATPLDKFDEWKMLLNPKNKYQQAQVAYLRRKQDDIIIAAALGDATAGKNRGTTVAFKDDSISINGDGTVTSLGTLAAVNTVADIGIDKMLLMLQIFGDEDVDDDLKLYWAVTPKTISDMLALTKVGSADYAAVKNLQRGMVDEYAGFNWFRSTRLTKDAASSTAYRSFAWAEDGIIFTQAKDVMVRISERADKRYMWQVYSCISCGAVRYEGEKVHECLNQVA